MIVYQKCVHTFITHNFKIAVYMNFLAIYYLDV